MRYILLILVFVLPTAGALAQSVQVQARVSDTTIGDEEMLVYSIEIKGASLSEVETPQPPLAQGLTLLQRSPSTQRNMTIINGRLEQTVAFRWNYRPISTGSAQIETAEVEVAGNVYATDPIRITVVDQAQRAGRTTNPNRQQWPFVLPSQRQDGEDEERSIEQRDLFIRAIPSASAADHNEQVTIEYQLYFRDGIQLRHSRLSGSWDAEGFWREEFNVETRPVPRSVVENGLLFHTIVLKRVAVFPTRPGTLTIDPLEIETEAYFPQGSSDPFERFFSLRSRFETVDLASEAVRINVQPLPSPAPASFAGAVGVYEMEADLSATRVEVGEPIQLTIMLRGTGNVATLEAPEFEPPGIFEQYDPDVDTKIDRDGDRIRGAKTFTFLLVPRSNGDFDMPPVTFTYYHPGEDRYVTVESDLPRVRVTGSASPLAAGTTTEGLPVDDIAAILPAAGSWTRMQDVPLYEKPWPYGALALPAGLLLLLILHQRRTERLANDREYARNRRAHPLAKKHLRRAEGLLRNDQPRAFYEEIERAVIGFVGNRLNIAELGLTREQMDARLRGAGVDEADRRALRLLLDECDQARFAPVLPDREAMESASERAAGIIVAVDDAAKKETSATAAA